MPRSDGEAASRKLFKALSHFPDYNPEIEYSRERIYKPQTNSGAKEQLTLFARNSKRLCDILACPWEIKKEPGHSGKMGHMGYLVARGEIFVLNPAGEGKSPISRSNCWTVNQIIEMWKIYDALDDSQKARKPSVKKEEEFVHKMLMSEGFVYRDYKAIGPALPRELGEYKREHNTTFWLGASTQKILNDLVNEKNEKTEKKEKKRARIDFVIRVKGGYVFLEVDEHQHEDKSHKDDGPGGMKRMRKIIESMRRAGIHEPIFVIRYNPHQYKIDGEEQNPPNENHLKELIHKIKSMDLTREPLFQIEYYYYDAITDASGEKVAEVTRKADYQEQYQKILSLENISSTPVSKKRTRQDEPVPNGTFELGRG